MSPSSVQREIPKVILIMAEPLKIGIFGGTRGVGRCALEQALDKGHTVTVLARNPQSLSDIQNPRLHVVHGDVLDKNAVASVVAGQDVIINSLGGSLKSDVNICSQGTRVILDAMKDANVKRIITVSSFGVGDSYQVSPIPIMIEC